MMLHNTFGMPALAKYDMQFSVSGGSFEIESVWPNLVFDALATASKPPKTVAVVSSKFPSVHFVSQGAREAIKKRGMTEVLYLDWDFGNRDFGAIASRIKEAKPDFLWVGGLGLEGTLLIDAMKKIDYAPPLQFVTFPAPGPMAKSPDGKGVLAFTVFEEHAPFLNNPVAAEFVKTFNERAAKANLPDTSVELMASVSFSTWQVLEAAVNATKSLDDKVLAAWLKKNQVDTIIGKVRWDGTNNFMKGNDLYKVKQVQNGKWMVVWPREFAAPGVKLIAP
jgi:branched-chain amino acid transport system substrate-binding protein